jgi:hypothetical protein
VLKWYGILLAVVMLVLNACATNEPTKSTEPATVPVAAHAQLAAASKLQLLRRRHLPVFPVDNNFSSYGPLRLSASNMGT